MGEKSYISVAISSMRFERLSCGRSCQTETKYLILLFFGYTPSLHVTSYLKYARNSI